MYPSLIEMLCHSCLDSSAFFSFFLPAERDFPPDVEAALSETFSSPPIAVSSKLENGHGEPACLWPCHSCGKNTLLHMSVFWNRVYDSNVTVALRKYRPFTLFQLCWLLECITLSCSTMPLKTISVSWKLQMIKSSKIKKTQVQHFYTFKYKGVENMCKTFLMSSVLTGESPVKQVIERLHWLSVLEHMINRWIFSLWWADPPTFRATLLTATTGAIHNVSWV